MKLPGTITVRLWPLVMGLVIVGAFAAQSYFLWDAHQRLNLHWTQMQYLATTSAMHSEALILFHGDTWNGR